MKSGADGAADTMNGDEIFSDRPFRPVREVSRKTELLGTGFPVRHKRRLPDEESEEDPENSL